MDSGVSKYHVMTGSYYKYTRAALAAAAVAATTAARFRIGRDRGFRQADCVGSAYNAHTHDANTYTYRV